MPEQVAVALRPPKSVAAVPDISEVMPMDAMTIITADHPTSNGPDERKPPMSADRIKTNPQNIAAGGPRRDWKILSETIPPANPPPIPKMHVYHPQWSWKNSAPVWGTLLQKLEYQF